MVRNKITNLSCSGRAKKEDTFPWSQKTFKVPRRGEEKVYQFRNKDFDIAPKGATWWSMKQVNQEVSDSIPKFLAETNTISDIPLCPNPDGSSYSVWYRYASEIAGTPWNQSRSVCYPGHQDYQKISKASEYHVHSKRKSS